jgi:putative transposase
VKPAVRREVPGHLQKADSVSSRRACSAVGFQRSSQRYRKRSDPQVELRMPLKELAAPRGAMAIAGCTFCRAGRAGW